MNKKCKCEKFNCGLCMQRNISAQPKPADQKECCEKCGTPNQGKCPFKTCPCHRPAPRQDEPSEWEQDYAFFLNELAPEIKIWEKQGRTKEQVYGVINFLTGQGGNGIRRFLASDRQQEREKVIREVVELSDKIEMEEPDGGTREWMAFKKFRNTMRDRLKEIKE